MEEILELEKQIEETNKHIEELKKHVEELKELKNKDKKEHKSLSDYRCCRALGRDDTYKYISDLNEINACIWDNEYEEDEDRLSVGNVYSIGTPNELLEREIKKRQLWFALEKHLKENNCLATDEDWKDENKIKFCVIYDFDDICACIHSWYLHKYNTIYSTNKEELQNYINTLSEEDIKIMFDVM